jgi:hypothetical protein
MYSRLLFIACILFWIVFIPVSRTLAQVEYLPAPSVTASTTAAPVAVSAVSTTDTGVATASTRAPASTQVLASAQSSASAQALAPATATTVKTETAAASAAVSVASAPTAAVASAVSTAIAAGEGKAHVRHREHVHVAKPATFPVVPRSPEVLRNWVQGIYITQPTLENAQRIQYLISQAKEVGINTFVIDIWGVSRRYRENIELVKQSGIKYVARIVMFPDGGTPQQISSREIWEKKYRLAEEAIALGAQQIQLDYIRYNTKQHPSEQNARDIYEVVKWFKERLAVHKIPLQIDVFGITSFGDSLYIGQDVPLFSKSADVICPMVYPSHYEPYQKYAKMPYYIIRYSLHSLRAQFSGALPFKLYPFIETYNYRYPLSEQEKLEYIDRQIAAVEDSGADGWLVWNPFNEYRNLFLVLKLRKGIKVAEAQPATSAPR